MTPQEIETLASLKALFERTCEKHGDAAARRLFLKATAKPPVKLTERGHGIQYWTPDDAA
jgi:hypothetical protein